MYEIEREKESARVGVCVCVYGRTGSWYFTGKRIIDSAIDDDAVASCDTCLYHVNDIKFQPFSDFIVGDLNPSLKCRVRERGRKKTREGSFATRSICSALTEDAHPGYLPDFLDFTRTICILRLFPLDILVCTSTS